MPGLDPGIQFLLVSWMFPNFREMPGSSPGMTTEEGSVGQKLNQTPVAQAGPTIHECLVQRV